MDRELAGAVLQRWSEGLPVYEGTLYKAASVLGLDPKDALAEARFYTALDGLLLEKRAMTPYERVYFSLAAGMLPDALEKTASAYNLTSDELVLEVLRTHSFIPDLEKIALLTSPQFQEEMQQVQDPAALEQQMQQQMAQGAPPPQPGAQVQQAPAARFKPTPTAPEQMAPGAGGNLQGLIQEQQGVHGQQATDNGGLPPAGMPEPPPPPPSPQERLSQIAPGLDPETLERYSGKLEEFEQQMGMPIQDPKQMEKFIKELQKVDKKYIDQGIKEMGQQVEQEMGVASQPQGAFAQPQQPQQPAAPQPAADSSPAEKVAHAARLLARRHVFG